MAYRRLLDETVEHEVGHHRDHDGHDVVHVDFEPTLGKGTDDQSLAAYTRSEDRILVTDDDEFVLAVDDTDVRAVFYLPDASLPVETVADMIHEVSKHYPQSDVDGVEYVGTEWL